MEKIFTSVGYAIKSFSIFSWLSVVLMIAVWHHIFERLSWENIGKTKSSVWRKGVGGIQLSVRVVIHGFVKSVVE